MGRQKRVDKNQADIVAELTGEYGYSVLHLHTVGSGAPDICVGAFGLNFLFEIKNPDNVPSKRRLTEDEEAFFKSWTGQVHKIETATEIVTIINLTVHEIKGEKE